MKHEQQETVANKDPSHRDSLHRSAASVRRQRIFDGIVVTVITTLALYVPLFVAAMEWKKRTPIDLFGVYLFPLVGHVGVVTSLITLPPTPEYVETIGKLILFAWPVACWVLNDFIYRRRRLWIWCTSSLMFLNSCFSVVIVNGWLNS